MRENEIKAAFVNYLIENIENIDQCDMPIVASEYVLGRSGVRADLAILGDEFLGVEIKGPRDKLSRLDIQIPTYSKYFDQTILIAHERFEQELTIRNYDGINIWFIDDELNIRIEHVAQTDQAFNEFRDRDRLELLAGEEISKFRPSTLARTRSSLQENAEIIFKLAFTARYQGNSNMLLKRGRQRELTSKDIEMLSPGYKRRMSQKKNAMNRKKFWEEWNRQARSVFAD